MSKAQENAELLKRCRESEARREAIRAEEVKRLRAARVDWSKPELRAGPSKRLH